MTKPNHNLYELSRLGDVQGVVDSIAHGADVHALYDRAICEAATHGRSDVVKVLIRNGAYVRALNDYPLRRAATNGHLDVVLALLKNGANVHAEYDQALRWASANGHTHVVAALEKHIKLRNTAMGRWL